MTIGNFFANHAHPSLTIQNLNVIVNENGAAIDFKVNKTQLSYIPLVIYNEDATGQRDDSIDSDAEEAYRYLYGLAIEDGIITPNERLMLEFTAENLNLSRAQIDIIEARK